jgi:glucose 1-dehydrogenase
MCGLEGKGSDMQGLQGKNVLVTGGSSGIGQAIAIRFGGFGSNVAINYRKGRERAEETEEMLQQCRQKVRGSGVKDVLVQANVAKEDDVIQMVQTTIDELGGLDILINNAGMQIAGDSHEIDTQDVERVLQINLFGAYMCAREAIKHWLKVGKPGVIVNVSSVHQVVPRPRYIGYTMSKGGMRNLTTTLALEYAKHGIRVNGIGPGATLTPINREWVEDEEKRKLVEEHIPMQRAAEADEMGVVTTFLASDYASYITGQTLFVDGGLTLYPSFETSWLPE